MYIDKTLSLQNLDYNFEETKKNIISYLINLERLNWEWKKLNTQKGLTINYNFETYSDKQPYTPIGKDIFNMSSKTNKEEQLKKYLSSYYWAYSILTETEKTYIKESFINHKYQDEVAELLRFNNRDDHEFRKLKRSAVYKFADFLNLVVES